VRNASAVAVGIVQEVDTPSTRAARYRSAARYTCAVILCDPILWAHLNRGDGTPHTRYPVARCDAAHQELAQVECAEGYIQALLPSGEETADAHRPQ
jgi:hypothetical protein